MNDIYKVSILQNSSILQDKAMHGIKLIMLLCCLVSLQDHHINFMYRIFYHTPRILSRNLRHYINFPTVVLVVILFLSGLNTSTLSSIRQRIDLGSIATRSPSGRSRNACKDCQTVVRQAWVRADHVSMAVPIWSFYIL